MPKLHVLQGPDKGRTYHTANVAGLIGRAAEPVLLTDQSASRRHAEVYPQNGHWMLVDLNSSNGTFLNGQRLIAPAELKDGDQIKVGNTLLLFAGQEIDGAPLAGSLLPDSPHLETKDAEAGSSILGSVEASQDSVIIQPPETADAVAAWNIVYKIAQFIGTTSTLDDFLERIADIITEYMVVERLVVFTQEPGEAKLMPRVSRSRSMGTWQPAPVITSEPIVRHVLEKREGVLRTHDLLNDHSTPGQAIDDPGFPGLRSVMCVPMNACDQINGIIYFDCDRSRHTFSPEQLRLAIAIGRLVGMAIENHRLMESRVKNERLAAVGETVAYLSHHIRNILQGLQGGAEVLELGFRKGQLETATSGWGLVRRNLDRIFDLTLNMLTFGKQRQPRVQAADLNKVVADVVTLALARANEKKVELRCALGSLPAVPLDAEGMHQAILNIVNNAIEAAPPESGKVLLSTQYVLETGEALVVISDNGPGIPAAELTRIFEPFYSAKGQGGTGLGLAAARKIIDELGGKIELVDGGGGATFRIRIPTFQVHLADSNQSNGPVS